MALVACRECGKEISTEAKACPNCGAPQSYTATPAQPPPKKKGMSLFGKIFLIFFGLVVLIGALTSIQKGGGAASNSSPQTSAAQAAEDAQVGRAQQGVQVLKQVMRNPDSLKFSGVLLMSDGAICYTYRAQNGFGGTDIAYAVMSPDGSNFKDSDEDGFTLLWNQECANKSGQDYSDVIH